MYTDVSRLGYNRQSVTNQEQVAELFSFFFWYRGCSRFKSNGETGVRGVAALDPEVHVCPFIKFTLTLLVPQSP